jgi:hypothetical protein
MNRSTFKKTNEVPHSERGVALLFVILLTSVLLMVAIGITNIAYREAAFSIEARDSDRAFFAADTGIECALMLDTAGFFSGTGVGSPMCNATSLSLVSSGGIYIFAIPVGPGFTSTQCAQITVDKNYLISGVSYTQIASVGYNVAAEGLPTSCVVGTPGPRVVTRALRTRYGN